MKNKSEKTVGYAVAICISAVLGVAGYFIFNMYCSAQMLVKFTR